MKVEYGKRGDDRESSKGRFERRRGIFHAGKRSVSERYRIVRYFAKADRVKPSVIISFAIIFRNCASVNH